MGTQMKIEKVFKKEKKATAKLKINKGYRAG
jgi:hypothetical protein